MSIKTTLILTLAAFDVIHVDMKKDRESPRPRKYRQKARARAAEETGRRILESFGAFMKDRWFDEITLDEVAATAGVTVRTVLRRFGGKEGLVDAYFESVSPGIGAQRKTPPGDIETAIDRVLTLYEEIGDGAIRGLAQESRTPALKTLLNGGRREHRRITAEVFSPWLDRLGEKDRRRLLDTVVIATDVYTWKLLRRDMGRSLSETRTVVLSMVRSALATVPPLNS